MKRIYLILRIASAALIPVLLRTPTVAARGTPACPEDVQGPRLVLIQDGGRPFCIDSREVRLGEYAKFAAAAAKEPPPQSAQCATNYRFVPRPNPDDHSTGAVDGFRCCADTTSTP